MLDATESKDMDVNISAKATGFIVSGPSSSSAVVNDTYVPGAAVTIHIPWGDLEPEDKAALLAVNLGERVELRFRKRFRSR